MSSKYKGTGCLKFFLVLIILAPLAYMGASYYNGQDGWANLKGLFGGDKKETSMVENGSVELISVEELQSENASLRKEVLRLEQSLKECREQNSTVK